MNKEEKEIYEEGLTQGRQGGVALCAIYLRGVQDVLKESPTHEHNQLGMDVEKITDAMLNAVHTI